MSHPPQARAVPDAHTRGALSVAFFCIAGVFAGALLWLRWRPESLLVAGPLVLLLAPIALVLLVVLYRQQRETTLVLLVPLVFIAVDLNLRPGPVAPGGGIDGQSVAKAVLYSLLALHGIATLARRRLPRGLSLLLLAYGIGAAASATYAGTVFLAVGGGVALIAAALAANSMARLDLPRIEQIWRYAFYGLAVLALGSVVLYFVWPDFAIATRVAGGGRLRGLTGAPNSLGPLMVVALTLALYYWRANLRPVSRGLLVAAMLVMLTALVLTGSRTAIGGFALALLGAAAASSVLFTWLALAVLGTALWLLLQPQWLYEGLRALAAVISRTGQVLELTTFTGRVEIWRFSVEKWLDAPWFGYGLGGARQVISEGWSNRWGGTTGTAHNMLLESLLSVGAVGTVLLFAVVIVLVVSLLREYRTTPPDSPQRPMRWLLLCLALFIVIDGFMEKSFAGLPSPQTLVLAMLVGSHQALRRMAVRG